MNRDIEPQPGETDVTRALRQLAGMLGAAVTATTNGAHTKTSYHYSGRAVDLAAREGPGRDTSALLNINEAVIRLVPMQMISELIYAGPGNICVRDGKPFRYSGDVMSRHHDHVHLAVVDTFTYTGSQEVTKPMADNNPDLPDIVGPVDLKVLFNSNGEATGYYIFSHATGELHSFGPGAKFFGRSEVTKLVTMGS